MQYKNVDKDPDLRKSSDVEATDRRWVRWVLAVLGSGAGIVLVVVAGLLAFKLFGWITGDDGNDAKAASAGAWASAVGATALALASAWLAVQANGQAREAEKRAQEEAALAAQRHQDELDAAEHRLQIQLDAAATQNEIDAQAAAERHFEQMDAEKTRYEADVARIEKQSRDRHRDEIRRREHGAVQAVLNALAIFVAEVNNHARAVETSLGLTEILADNTEMSDSEKFKIELELIIRGEASQMALLRTSNDCMMTVRTSMYQITTRELMGAVSKVFEKMTDTAKCFTTANKDNDWDEAVRQAMEANDAGLPLQKNAAYRFLPTDDEIPSQLPLKFASQPERRSSTDPDEEPATH